MGSSWDPRCASGSPPFVLALPVIAPAAGTGQAVKHTRRSHSADACGLASCLQELEEVGGLDELEKELARIRSRGM